MTKVLRTRDSFKTYATMAGNYSSMVSSVDGLLSKATNEIDKINSILSVGKVSANDLLTCNVVAGSEEIKSEIKTVSSNINSYTGLLKKKATKLDDAEYAQYLSSQKSNNKDSNPNSTT